MIPQRGDLPEIDAKNGEVSLAEIPFVRLRDGLPEELLNGEIRFHDAVTAAQRALGPAELTIDTRNRRVRAGGRMVELPPVQLAFLAWIARRQRQRKSVTCPSEGAPNRAYADEFLVEYRAAIGPVGKRRIHGEPPRAGHGEHVLLADEVEAAQGAYEAAWQTRSGTLSGVSPQARTAIRLPAGGRSKSHPFRCVRPVNHTLVTMIGKAGKQQDRLGYRRATYHFPDGREEQTVFFGLALARQLRPDDVVILGTAASHWSVLAEHLADDISDEQDARLELLGAEERKAVTQELLDRLAPLMTRQAECRLHPRLIPFGKDETEQYAILKIINETVPDGKLSFDVTHGFRHFGMVGLSLVVHDGADAPP